jgi:DNA replication initiation complex subunit (GINS family)
MLKAEKIKKEIDVLPNDMLDEVEKFIKSLKPRKKKWQEEICALI